MTAVRLAWIVVLVALAPSSHAGETIFRCGNSYSSTPCADAKAVDAGATPSPAQRAEARAVAAREKQLALAMVREREERARAIRPAAAASLGPAPAARIAVPPASPKKNARAKKPVEAEDVRGDFIAAVPRTKR